MVVIYIFDTREKKNGHIKRYFDDRGIAYRVEKLDAGDYMLEGGSVTVDRKASIEEISGNLLNPADKRRFWNEVRLARQKGLRLVVLVETNKYKTVQDLQPWRSKYTPVRGSALIRQMEKLRHAFGVQFVFCPKVSAARRILEILEET